MEKELIYKDDARRAILKADPSLAYCIDNIKAVDAKPVVCGEWVKQVEGGFYWYACSKCGVEVPRGRYGHDWYSDYCPSCGADMRGVKDGIQ